MFGYTVHYFLHRIVQCVLAGEEVNRYLVTYVDEQGIKEMAKDAEEIDELFPSSLAEQYTEKESQLKSGEARVQISEMIARPPARPAAPFLHFSPLLFPFLSLVPSSTRR